jgi:hypothetical protein
MALKVLGTASLFLAALLAVPIMVAEPAESPQSVEILNKYLTASEQQRAHMKGMLMETDIDAKIPKLQKEGKLHALRHISRIGRITYNALRFTGDTLIKKEVIARFLTAETEAVNSPTSLAINTENYKFKYKGLANRQGLPVHVFELKPHKKAVGLFKGEVWVDPETYYAVRESGTFVKNPSVFLKKVQFTRVYTIQNGVALLSHVDTVIDTRIVGRAELSVNYSDYRPAEEDQASLLNTSENQ